MADEIWYRIVADAEGSRYEIVHWKGGALLVAMLIAACAIMLVTAVLFHANVWGVIGGVILMVIVLVALMRLSEGRTVDTRPRRR